MIPSIRKTRIAFFAKIETPWGFNENSVANAEKSVGKPIEKYYKYYINNIEQLPDFYKELMDLGQKPEMVVCDHISSMTDRYAINKYHELFVPDTWHG